ncbi:hypothetical protein TUMSATVNIG3_00470 [Vibrio nigripulchritudo]|nr:hypothetical protein TUMSATVNIG2_00470 [Vibrio nigripulchritudo]BDU41249.1 hypothetical protein TUMSATVNIG3_00470 [Vibrio nigripulchritudo]
MRSAIASYSSWLTLAAKEKLEKVIVAAKRPITRRDISITRYTFPGFDKYDVYLYLVCYLPKLVAASSHSYATSNNSETSRHIPSKPRVFDRKGVIHLLNHYK